MTRKVSGRTLSAGGTVSLLSVTNSSYLSTTASKSSAAWQSSSDKGHNDTTVQMTGLTSGGDLTISAGKGIVADYKSAGDLQNSLAALAKDPQTAWVAQLASQNNVTWNAVQEAHKSWDHESQGLSAMASVIIAIVVAVVTAGAGAELAGLAAAGEGTAAGGAAAVAGTTEAAAATTTVAGFTVSTSTAAAFGAAANAGLSTLASQAAISLINNQGDLGKTLQQMGSLDTVKNIAISMASAGALSEVSSWNATTYPKLTTLPNGATATTYSQIAQFSTDWSVVGAKTLIAGGIGGLSSTALGGSFWTGLGMAGGMELSSDLYRSLVASQPSAWGGDPAYIGKETYTDQNGKLQYLQDPISSVSPGNNWGVPENLRLQPETVASNPWIPMEGTTLSNFVDSFPFMEATAQFHDNWLGYIHGIGSVEQSTNQFLNYGTMLPAFTISSGAVLSGTPSVVLVDFPSVQKKADDNAK